MKAEIIERYYCQTLSIYLYVGQFSCNRGIDGGTKEIVPSNRLYLTHTKLVQAQSRENFKNEKMVERQEMLPIGSFFI